jgi:hypothetical protein
MTPAVGWRLALGFDAACEQTFRLFGDCLFIGGAARVWVLATSEAFKSFQNGQQ